MKFDLSQKCALVTGGSDGIGRAICEGLAASQAEIIFTYRDRKKADQILHSWLDMGIKASSFQCDFSSREEFKGLLQYLEELGKPLDILVNNVGFLTRDSFLDISEEKLRLTTQINFEFPFLLSQWAAQKAKKFDRPLSIINISSLSSKVARSKVAAYQSSKAALNMLSKSIAAELGGANIRANTILPGLTKTNANREQWFNDLKGFEARALSIPCGRVGLPQDYVGLCLLLASDESSWINGSEFVIDGGMSSV